MDKYSYLSNGDVAVFEDLYTTYKRDNSAVDFGWQKFFEGFELASKSFDSTNPTIPENFQKEFKVINLINGYRSRGHLFTKTNPVRERRKYLPTLDIENFGLAQEDLDAVFQAGNEVGIGAASLREIITHLNLIYCQSIGMEYMYIRKPEEVDWIKQQLHINSNTPTFSIEQKKHILNKLNEAVVFESFLHTKFVGQKRFSLEGLEALIPALDAIVEHGAEYGVEECVFGMAHRGRLNVLANVFHKTYQQIFTEFEGKAYDDSLFEGDVKYHLGFSSNVTTSSGKKVHLTMTANPSHLEAVDPVVEGIAKAKLDDKYNGDTTKIIPILIHGDASISGQGIVYEVVQMAGLEGYHTGGTIHIVTNNQVGFTTNYTDGRTSTYCTDVAKVTLSPVFHVNADDVEAVVHAIQMAVRYRQTYHKDVFIDLLGYRKYGHNEGDEPRFTQPLLYKAISKHPNIREIYIKKLTESGLIEADLAKNMERKFKALLNDRLTEAKEVDKNKVAITLEASWKGIRQSKKGDFDQSPETGVTKKKLTEIGQKVSTLPKDKKFFKKIEKVLDDRAEMIKNNAVDWGMAEHIAFGTLLMENHSIRFSGQDVERGTFSHRHAVLKIEDSEEEYVPLNNLSDKQSRLLIYNSHLSEFGVLGFEYGYSLASPNALTIWEAQFGDFANGAQTIIDQFISCAEDKWKRLSNLVLLLPHGYEGQGAEHSSARMERYLQLCGEANMQVVNCTTPANYFHVLRRQVYWEFRKPLVIFTPKKLLRYPRCVSTLDEMAVGSFQEVIDDTLDPKNVDTVVLCCGKIYYELLEKREEIESDSIAFIRMEQLYPFPKVQLEKILSRYKKVKKWLWVQEEPANQGAWMHMLRYYRKLPMELVSRPGSGTTATGSHSRHDQQCEDILNKVFANQLVK